MLSPIRSNRPKTGPGRNNKINDFFVRFAAAKTGRGEILLDVRWKTSRKRRQKFNGSSDMWVERSTVCNIKITHVATVLVLPKYTNIYQCLDEDYIKNSCLSKLFLMIILAYQVSYMFILLSRESSRSTVRVQLKVVDHLCPTLVGNSVK